MKRLFAVFAMGFGCALACWASQPEPLSTLRAIHLLTHAEAALAPAVSFEATVTYFPGYGTKVQPSMFPPPLACNWFRATAFGFAASCATASNPSW